MHIYKKRKFSRILQALESLQCTLEIIIVPILCKYIHAFNFSSATNVVYYLYGKDIFLRASTCARSRNYQEINIGIQKNYYEREIRRQFSDVTFLPTNCFSQNREGKRQRERDRERKPNHKNNLYAYVPKKLLYKLLCLYFIGCIKT